MNRSRKCQVAIVLIVACVTLSVLAAEPNEPKIKLKFETSNEQLKWRYGSGRINGMGPIRPTHVAKLFIKDYGNLPGTTRQGGFERLLQTDVSKSMSAKQREFLATSSSYDRIKDRIPGKPIDYVSFHLYAVSQDDAKKMAHAFIESLKERAQERIKRQEDYISEREQKIAKAKKELPEKQSQLKKIEEEYKAAKSSNYWFSSDEEAVSLSKESILENDKTLDKLNIEIAGISERLKVIEMYRNKPNQRDTVYQKLDEMFIELTIELRGFEAKRAITEKIRNEEQKFLSLFNEREKLRNEVAELSNTSQIKIDYNWRDIPEVLPPVIYQNKVTIYPVLAE
jgi:hypothetical protein